MKRPSAIRELWVGVLLTVGFVVFFVLLISVGEQHNLLSPKVTFHSRFDQTQGLNVGAPVRLEGVPVGSVTDIAFPDDPNDHRIIVTFQVDSGVAGRIRKDSKAILVSQGLIGEVLLGLKRGSPRSPPAEPGSFLEARETGSLEEFKSQGQVIAENLISISGDIQSIVERIERGEGLLARVLTDEEFAQEFLGRLDETSEALQEIVSKLNAGESFLGRLLASSDPEASASADALLQTIRSFESIVRRVERGEGTLGSLVQGESRIEDIMARMEETLDSIQEVTRDLEEGEGLAARLIRDEELAEQILDDLREASANVATITARLERGEGTLGALLVDPSIYEGMQDLVGGIQESRILRWFIRRKVKKGARSDRKGAEGDVEDASPPAYRPRRQRGEGPVDARRGLRRD